MRETQAAGQREFEGALTEALASLGEQDAQGASRAFARVARAGSRHGLRCQSDRPVVLVLEQDWYEFGLGELCAALVEEGCFPVLMDPEVPLGETLPGVDQTNWRGLRHRDVPLSDVAAYDFCVRRERTFAELSPLGTDDLAALAAEYGRAVRLLDRVAEYFSVFAPAVVCLAQGHVLASAGLRAMALRENRRVVALENTLHRERLLWDDGAALPVVANPVRASWWRRTQLDSAADAEYADRYLRDVRGLKSAQHAGPAAGAVVPKGVASSSKKRILYLGQVSTDSAVLWGLSPGFARQVDVLRAVTAHAAEGGHRVVAKLHPKERDGSNPLGLPYRRLTLRQIEADASLREWRQSGVLEVDGDNALDTYDEIERADACITVNSQAGLEALLAGRELVLCGRAFYGGLGFTHDADGPETVAACLDRALDPAGRRNHGSAVRAFFRHYLEEQCIAQDAREVAGVLALGLGGSPTKPAVMEKDYGYASGERQTAFRWEEIRRDHRARYEFACDALRTVASGRGLSGVDAFCGNGYGTQRLAESCGAQVLGVDGSADAIAVAEEHFAAAGASYRHACFPFALAERSLDFAVSFESIEHVEDDAAFLGTVAEALRPGALLFLSAPNESALPFRSNADYFGHHVRHYTQQALEDLAGAVGLVPRLALGQDVYRVQDGRVIGSLAEEEMELADGLEAPQFWIQVFERLTTEDVAPVAGRGFEGRPLAELGREAPASVSRVVSRELRSGDLARVEDAAASWFSALAPGGGIEFRWQSGGDWNLDLFSRWRRSLRAAGFQDVITLTDEGRDAGVAAWRPPVPLG